MANSTNGSTPFNTNEWEGRTGRSWAAEWRRTDRSFAQLTPHLLGRLTERDFTFGLDIGCGAGELSLALAQAGSGENERRITGVDVSPALIEVARLRAESHPDVSFELGDAARWFPSDGQPDLLFSRHGVMFFPQPVEAFRHLHGLAAPSARLLFSCFRGPQVNEIFTGVARLLPPSDVKPDPHAPGPMAFADPDYVRDILTQAGWQNVEFESFDFSMIAGAGDDAVSDAVEYFSVIGPVAATMAEIDSAEREAFRERLRAYVQSQESGGQVAMDAGAWIVSATYG